MQITLPHNFIAREYQKNFFRYLHNGGKRAVLVWNRRAGKDVCAWNFLISAAMEKRGIYYYVFPKFAQGRKVLWDGMTSDGFKFLDYIPKELVYSLNNQEMKVKLRNGSIIQVVGSDNYDSLMGTNPAGCIFSEYSLQNPNAWQFVRPILDANKGWAIFVFTPRGANHAKDIFDMARQNPHWFGELLTLKETEVITADELTKIRLEGMSEDMIQQEWFCSFTLGIQGSYYANYIEEAREEGRILPIAWDRNLPVHTAWDIGVGDSTSIVFWQVAGKEMHIIDHYEADGEGLPHYIQHLKSKPYIYGQHFAPHDIMGREFSTGHSRFVLAQKLGIEFSVIKTFDWSIEEGIESVRGLFPRMWFEKEKAARILKSLENYRKEYDEKNAVYKARPKHDQWSHCADAIRYMAIAMRSSLDADKGPSDSEVERWRDKHQPRFN